MGFPAYLLPLLSSLYGNVLFVGKAKTLEKTLLEQAEFLQGKFYIKSQKQSPKTNG